MRRKTSRPRRAVLTAAAALVVFSAAHPGIARGPHLDAEAAQYGGTSTGMWACGPTARVLYGGGAGNVTVSSRGLHDPDGEGMRTTLGGAVERETLKLKNVTCAGACQPEDSVLPPSATMFAGHARVGYGWKYIGLEGGALVVQGWARNVDRRPTLQLLPEFALRAGRLDGVYAVAGVGSPSVTTLRRPAVFYGGITYAGLSDWDIGGTVGMNRTGPALLYMQGGGIGDLAVRADLVSRLRIIGPLWIRAGGGVSLPRSAEVLDGEFTFGLGASF